MATKTFLKQFHPVSKFVAVKTVIFMTFWQGLVIDMVPGLGEEEAHKWTVCAFFLRVCVGFRVCVSVCACVSVCRRTTATSHLIGRGVISACLCAYRAQDLLVTFEMIIFALMQLNAFGYKGTASMPVLCSLSAPGCTSCPSLLLVVQSLLTKRRLKSHSSRFART